jgi:hypothetical protein
VFYDLKSCLRQLGEQPAQKPKRTTTRRTTTRKKKTDAGP